MKVRARRVSPGVRNRGERGHPEEWAVSSCEQEGVTLSVSHRFVGSGTIQQVWGESTSGETIYQGPRTACHNYRGPVLNYKETRSRSARIIIRFLLIK